MRFTPGDPIVWRVSLASSREHVFRLLDTDNGRERHWSRRSQATADGFDLELAGGLREHVTVLERSPPAKLRISYFGAETDFALLPSDRGGCILQVTCRCNDVAEWVEFLPGWVSWLLVLKAAADFDVDLRTGHPDRTWSERYVDP